MLLRPVCCVGLCAAKVSVMGLNIAAFVGVRFAGNQAESCGVHRYFFQVGDSTTLEGASGLPPLQLF